MTDKRTKTRKTSAAAAKQELLSAYADTIQETEVSREADMKPEEKVAEKERKAAIAGADALISENISRQIGALKADVGKALAQVGELLEAEVGRYQEVKRAVEAKDQELQEIYEIQRSASTLAALLEIQQDKRQEFELETAAKQEALTAEIERIRKEWDAEKKGHEAQIKDRDGAEQKRRDREREEYEYKFKREQQLAREQFEDQRARAEREWELKKGAMESALVEREKAVSAREAELNELRQKVAGASAEQQSAVAQAVKDVTARLQKDAVSREELARKEFEGERNVLMARIEALERTAKDQGSQVAKMSQQLDKAYGQVQDIAVKTVEGVSRAKAFLHAEQMAAEQTRKQAQEKG